MKPQAIIDQLDLQKKYVGAVYRMVESQQEAATLALVDDLDEQAQLEALLDVDKPNYRDGTEGLHYLLSTPFRYPPLQYGSRFGDRTMPSYFYASESVKTALAETAYYRFLFLSHMATAYENSFTAQFMSFSINVTSSFCVDLTTFDGDTKQQLMHPSDYRFTQAIGQKLLTTGVELIRFWSVRDLNEGVNVAISNPKVFKNNQPENIVNWLVQTNHNQIKMKPNFGEVVVFDSTYFGFNTLI